MIRLDEIIINVLEAGICLWFINKKFSEERKITLTSLLFLFFTLELTVATYYAVPTFIRVFISIAILFVYAIALKPQRYLHKLFFSTLAVLLTGAADLLVVALLSMLTGATVEILVSTRLLQIQGALASKAILIVLFFLLTRRKYDQTVKGPLWLLLYCIPVVSITLLFIFMRYQVNTHSESTTLFAITVGFVFISCSTVLLYDRLAEYMQRSFQEGLMAQQLDAQLGYNIEMQRMNEESRGLRHDMANHIQALHGLIEDGNQDEALTYLGNIEAIQAKQRLRLNTGNAAIDAIVGSKISYAQSLGIHLDHHILLPNPLRIQAMELCAVLGNLLDNAIEACQQVVESPTIKLEVGARTADHIAIIIENSYIPRSNLLRSQKGPGHGIGLLNIKRIVGQRGGVLEIEQTPETFIVRVLIPN